MKYFFFLLFFFCKTLSNANSINNESKKKCINEFLLPCSSNEKLTSVKPENKKNIKLKIKNDIKKDKRNLNIPKRFEEKIVIKNRNLSKKKLIVRNKIVLFTDVPNTDLDKNMSFNKFESQVIKYSDKNDFPDINE